MNGTRMSFRLMWFLKNMTASMLTIAAKTTVIRTASLNCIKSGNVDIKIIAKPKPVEECIRLPKKHIANIAINVIIVCKDLPHQALWICLRNSLILY